MIPRRTITIKIVFIFIFHMKQFFLLALLLPPFTTSASHWEHGEPKLEEEFVILENLESPLLSRSVLEQLDLPEKSGIYSAHALEPFLQYSHPCLHATVSPHHFYFRPVTSNLKLMREIYVIYGHSFFVRWGAGIFWQLLLVTGHIVTLIRGAGEEWKPLMVIRPHQSTNPVESVNSFHYDPEVPLCINELAGNSILLERTIIEANRLQVLEFIQFRDYSPCFLFLGFPSYDSYNSGSGEEISGGPFLDYFGIERKLIQDRIVPIFDSNTGGNLLRRSVGSFINWGTITAGKSHYDFLGLLDNEKAKRFLLAVSSLEFNARSTKHSFQAMLFDRLCFALDQIEQKGVMSTKLQRSFFPELKVYDILMKAMEEHKFALTRSTRRISVSSSSTSSSISESISVGTALARIMHDRLLLHSAAILYDRKLTWLLPRDIQTDESDLSIQALNSLLAYEFDCIRADPINKALSESLTTVACTYIAKRYPPELHYIWKRKGSPAWGAFRYFCFLYCGNEAELEEDPLYSLEIYDY